MDEVLTQETSQNLDRITACLHRLGLDTHGDLNARSDRLEQFYLKQAHVRGTDLALCDTCDRQSDSELHACPFCGDAEPVQPYPEGIIPTTPEKMKYSLYTVEHLDEAVQSIRQSARIAQERIFEVAKTLELIKKEQLWRFRLREDGKLKYKNLYEFTRAELGISKSYACRLIRVVSEYQPSDIKRFGVSRLDFSLRLPEKRRPKFLNEAEKLSARGPELASLAKQMMPPAEPKSSPVSTIKPPSDKIKEAAQKTKLVSMPLGISTVAMHKRSTDMKKHGRAIGAPTEPAKSIIDMPWCRVWLDKTTALYIRIGQNTMGEVEATLEVREGEDSVKLDKSVLKYKYGRE